MPGGLRAAAAAASDRCVDQASPPERTCWAPPSPAQGGLCARRPRHAALRCVPRGTARAGAARGGGAHCQPARRARLCGCGILPPRLRAGALLAGDACLWHHQPAGGEPCRPSPRQHPAECRGIAGGGAASVLFLRGWRAATPGASVFPSGRWLLPQWGAAADRPGIALRPCAHAKLSTICSFGGVVPGAFTSREMNRRTLRK